MTAKQQQLATEGLKHIVDGNRALRELAARIDNEETNCPVLNKSRLQLQRTINHLSEAIADVPESLWAVMIAEAGIKPDELSKALNAA